MSARVVLLILSLSVIAADGGAQTARRRPRTVSSSSNAAVRAELAKVLLESGKYSEAAGEYRALLARDPRNSIYRLSLAKALAWGNSFREADRELTILASMRGNDPEVEQVQRSVRVSLEPSSAEARQWVVQDPFYRPYRMALARALAREHQYRDALAILNDLVARAPADTAYRLALIDVLTSDHRYAAALAQSDTLLSFSRTPSALVSRARLDIARDDLGAAERDLIEALQAKPSAESYLLLGDTYRWRGEFGKARTAYESARIMRGGHAVTEAFAQLARDERSMLTFDPPSTAAEGWRTTATYETDNGGIDYSTMDFRRGFDLGAGFVGSAGLEVRQLHEASPTTQGAAGSYAAKLGLAREGIAGPFYGRVDAVGGPVFQPLAQTVGAASLALTGRYYAWSASVALSAGPAYPVLRTLSSILPLGKGSTPLTQMGTSFSLAGPIGIANIALGLERASISDENQRSEVQGYARLPLNPTLSLIYWGSSIAFAKPSTMYWSPDSYTSNAAGVEIAARQLRGWSLLVRALPGIASTTSSPFIHASAPDTGSRQLRFQITTGGELAYRQPEWEFGFGFNWGRVANYTRTGIAAHLTLGR